MSNWVLYLLTPFLIYRCDQGLYSYMDQTFIVLYNFLYLILLAAVILTMKLTRRANGFKSSTLDFLVIFVILLIPNLPDAAIKGYHFGLVAVKSVILFYSYRGIGRRNEKKKDWFTDFGSHCIIVVGLKSYLFTL